MYPRDSILPLTNPGGDIVIYGSLRTIMQLLPEGRSHNVRRGRKLHVMDVRGEVTLDTEEFHALQSRGPVPKGSDFF